MATSTHQITVSVPCPSQSVSWRASIAAVYPAMTSPQLAAFTKALVTYVHQADVGHAELTDQLQYLVHEHDGVARYHARRDARPIACWQYHFVHLLLLPPPLLSPSFPSPSLPNATNPTIELFRQSSLFLKILVLASDLSLELQWYVVGRDSTIFNSVVQVAAERCAGDDLHP
ncbi:hypothetical protein K470DRAFT_152391 [Piedraia hortae CBS 480.64]|uniref:Uncharacterized protein n=1 Tax=Piedraia hortae CBS 480.64 TaxID=1314780 RepID=A0A6A7BRK7_9PEZI|nr:hypothetical protein K470DRAFT_152391 [Piedraia hortae CBS 480.64]